MVSLYVVFAAQVSGVVLLPDREGPQPGAEVRMGRAVAVTDSDGGFALDVDDPAQPVVLRVGGRQWTLGTIPLNQEVPTELTITLPVGDAEPHVEVKALEARKIQNASEVQLAVLKLTIFDRNQKTPIAGARVVVRGSSHEATTDSQGIARLQVPAGDVGIAVIARGFTTEHQSVRVEAQGATTEVLLEPSGVTLDAYTVAAPRLQGNALALLEERRQSASVADLLGAEQMSQSGDGDAASAMRRVTGVTLVGGRFIYVRGLGERYASTLLDGAPLPSPDPERRVVPLDLFPTDFIGSIAVQKTFSADLPGNFGGGLVQIRSREVPKQLQASVSLSMGWHLGTTNELLLMGDQGPTDWLGFDGGHRSLPPEVAQASAAQPLLQTDMFSDRGYTAAELERLGEAMPNRWGTQMKKAPPNLGMSATLGDGFKIFGKQGGYMLAFTHGNAWTRTDRLMNIFTMGTTGLELAHRYQFEGSNRNIPMGGLVALGWQPRKGHKLSLNSLLVRISDDEIMRYSGRNRDVATDIRITRYRFLERTVLSENLRGEHRLSLGTFDWRLSGGFAARSEPDRRQLRYDYEPGVDEWYLSGRPDGNRRVFSDLFELHLGGAANLKLKLKGWGKDASQRMGLTFDSKDRDVDTRRYRFMQKGELSRSAEVQRLAPDAIFSPENIGSDGYQIQETTLATDNYRGVQFIGAGYWLADIRPTKNWRLLTGLRLEYGLLRMETFEPFNPNATPITSELKNIDWLPSATATYSISKQQLLRLALARTASRPDIRELSPATFNAVTGGRQIYGNPDLKRAIINHFDLRYEWFPQRGDVVSFSLFGKYFEQPIETVVIPSAQLSVSFDNATSATNMGLEVEARRSLASLSPAFKGFTVAGNAALIQSNIVVPEGTIQTNTKRPLQGQSPYVLNGQVIHQAGKKNRRVTTSIIYNIFGRRISEVGALGAPDTYEEPFAQLDLVTSAKLPHQFKIGLKFKNILDPKAEYQQGAETVVSRRKGRAIGLSISRSFK